MKTADLQAHNASQREALWACRSAIFTKIASFLLLFDNLVTSPYFFSKMKYLKIRIRISTFTKKKNWVHSFFINNHFIWSTAVVLNLWKQPIYKLTTPRSVFHISRRCELVDLLFSTRLPLSCSCSTIVTSPSSGDSQKVMWGPPWGSRPTGWEPLIYSGSIWRVLTMLSWWTFGSTLNNHNPLCNFYIKHHMSQKIDWNLYFISNISLYTTTSFDLQQWFSTCENSRSTSSQCLVL